MMFGAELETISETGSGFVFAASDDPARATPWDSFLRDHPGAPWEQSVGWGLVKQHYGWKPHWVWVSRNGRVVGGAMILARRVGASVTVAIVDRGPVWVEDEPGAMAAALSLVTRVARRLRCAYVAVIPPCDGHALVPLLESEGFFRKPDPLPPGGVVTATLLVDLRLDLDELRRRMSSSTRKNIRVGSAKGVRVRVGHGGEADTFRDLMWALCARRGVSPTPPQRDFFSNLWSRLGEQGRMKFLFAEVGGQIVAGACLFLSGGVASDWKVGWNGACDHFNPNYVLRWETIKWAKEQGCHTYDFVQVLPHHARAILRGEKVEDAYSGVTSFKLGFGGNLKLLPEPYYRSFVPVVQTALRFGGARVIDSALGQTLARRAGNAFKSMRRLAASGTPNP